MIISEKQIMQLIYIATEFRRELLQHKAVGNLSATGQQSLDDTSAIIQQINTQQSEELKVIK
jgi:hypothetical protein